MEVTFIIKFKHSILYKARRKLGMTQKAVASAIGVSQILYGNWENFKAHSHGRKLKKRQHAVEELSKLFGLSFNEMFPEEHQRAVERSLGKILELDFKVKELPEWSQRARMLPDPEITYEAKEKKRILLDSLKQLTPRERRILIMLYGLEEIDGEMTRQEVANAFSLTGERIRQIEEKAIRKIRALYKSESQIFGD